MSLALYQMLMLLLSRVIGNDGLSQNQLTIETNNQKANLNSVTSSSMPCSVPTVESFERMAGSHLHRTPDSESNNKCSIQ